jgi:hypothetical protein
MIFTSRISLFINTNLIMFINSFFGFLFRNHVFWEGAETSTFGKHAHGHTTATSVFEYQDIMGKISPS